MSAFQLLLLGLICVLILLILHGGSRTRRAAEPPLIKGWIPILGKTVEFGKNSFKFLLKHQRKHGDIFTVRIAGKYMTFILNPLLFPNIIKNGQQLDFHDFFYELGSSVFGYALMSLKRFPDLQKQVRRAFVLLQGDHLPELTESMLGNMKVVIHRNHLAERSEEEKGSWTTHGIYEFCNSILFEASLLTMHGKPLHSSHHSGVDAILKNFIKYDTMFPLLVAGIPLWLLGQIRMTRQKLINIFLPQKTVHWTSVSRLVLTRQELFQQYKLRDVDKAAHSFAILWASTANTVPATFWALYHVVSHPEVMEVLRQELLDVLSQSGVVLDSVRDIHITKDQLDKLIYLESAVKESLRLSSASTNIRIVKEDVCLQLSKERLLAVRKGDVVALYPQIIHMDPEIYEDPETYHFDRFVQDGKEKLDFYKEGQKLKYYLLPFGTGASKCPGRHFALCEIKQFLCLMLLTFDLQLEEGQTAPTLDYSRAGLGILWPSTDVRFRIRLRKM